MQDTREYIIEEAYKLFLNSSYEAVSISDISQAIGLTKGALYHHFKNKEELFKAVIDKYLILHSIDVDIENISLKEFNDLSLECMEKIIKHIFIHSENFDSINYMSLFVDSFRKYDGYAKEKLNFFQNEIEKIKIVLKNAIKCGEIREDIDIDAIAQLDFSITMSIASTMIFNNSISNAILLIRQQLNELYKLLKK